MVPIPPTLVGSMLPLVAAFTKSLYVLIIKIYRVLSMMTRFFQDGILFIALNVGFVYLTDKTIVVEAK